MEELLIVIIQGIGEIALQIVAYSPFDLLDWPSMRTDGRAGPWTWSLVLVALGAILGGVVDALHPHVLIAASWGRISCLAAGPAVNGYVAQRIARWRLNRGNASISPRTHFLYDAVFSSGYLLIRFGYATR